MKRFIGYCGLIFMTFTVAAQQADNTLPFAEVPDYPEKFTAGTVMSRLVDGLGFRYYWATDSLTDRDLNFKPNQAARTTKETLYHIWGLSKVIVNAVKQVPNIRSADAPDYSYAELRKMTLQNLQEASSLLRSAKDKDFEKFKVVFENPNGKSEYPFWNNINGPIADAIWHTGQIVSFRRSSGNPFNSNVSLFRGKLRNQ